MRLFGFAFILARAVFALVFIGATQLAAAHPAPFSYFDFYLDAEGAHGAVVIHDFDAAHELGLEKPESLLDPSVALDRREALVRLVESRIRLIADGRAMTPAWGAIEVLTERQSLRLPFRFGQSLPGKLDIDVWLFPYDANHQSFINIYESGALKHQAILDAHRRTLNYYSGGLQGRWAVTSTFVQAGIQHILIGPDHVLFLLGLMLLGGSWRRLAAIVTAFTIGHSITLSLAALDVVRMAPSIVEPAIALSIVVVGVDNLLVNRQRRLRAAGQLLATDSRDLRPWLAAVFGLIHGFGFAAVLIEFGLPRAALGWSLAAFNIGVEIGQLAIVLVLVLVMTACLTALRGYRAVFAERLVTIGSAAVIAAGVYWFVQRIGFTSAA